MSSVIGIQGSLGGTSTSQTSGSGLGTLDGNDFITLLTAQLQAQDPDNAADPTEWVSELAQFSQLQELIQIQQTLQGIASTFSSGNSGSASTSSTNQIAG